MSAGPRDRDGPASPAADPEKPLGGVGVDGGVAGQIPLWSSDPSLMPGVQHHGFPLAQGTVTDGLQKIAALFEPLMPVLTERQMGEKLLPWRRNAVGGV